MATAPIVQANADELDNYEIDNADSIIALGDIPQQPPHASLVVNDNDNDDDTVGSGDDNNDKDIDEDEDKDNLSDKDEDNEPAAVTDALEGNESDGDQGV